MSKMMNRKDVKLPKVVYLQTTSDFTRFEEVLRTLCEKFLSHDWDWTFRVGGRVQREIEKRDPENPGLHKILEGTQKKPMEKGGEYNPWKEERQEIEEKGPEEKQLQAQEIPAHPQPPPAALSRVVEEVMGKRGWEIDKMKKEDDERFFNIHKYEFEDSDLLSVRKEIWDWVVECVQGEKKDLFCTHLLREVDKWDIHLLYRNVRDFLNTENYKEFGQRIEKYFTAQPTNKEDIFTYISRLDKYTEEIEHLQHLATEAGETLAMPKFYRVWKILSAVEKYPEYRIFTDKIQQMPPQEWIRLDTDQIRTELHKIHSNNTSLQKEVKQENVGFMARGPPPPLPQAAGGGGGAGPWCATTHQTQNLGQTHPENTL
jgi:hypothetical protein